MMAVVLIMVKSIDNLLFNEYRMSNNIIKKQRSNTKNKILRCNRSLCRQLNQTKFTKSLKPREKFVYKWQFYLIKWYKQYLRISQINLYQTNFSNFYFQY